jgi:hypothetical protein
VEANLDGTGVTTLVTGQNGPFAVAVGPEDTRGSGMPPRLLAVVADLFRFFRGEPGNDRGPRGRIQGVELVMDVLHRQIGFLVLLT